jgi:ribosomal protein S12 methylthiotransferase accessory factor
MNLEYVNNRLSQIGIHLNRALKMKGGKIKSSRETLQTGLNQLKKLSTPIDFKITQIDHDFLNIPIFQFQSKLTSTGKGLDEDSAKASAIMEFIERYSWKKFLCFNQENIVYAAMDELSDVGFNEEYFSNNLIENSVIKKNFSKIKKIKMRWIKAYSISNDRFIWYPLFWHKAVNLSNGLASGNSFTEAIVQATCEVIERNVYSKIVYSEETSPTIDVNPSRWPRVASLLDEFKSNEVRLILKDMTDSIKIPSILAWAHDDSCDIVKDVCGMGTHLSPEEATIRAITECAQARAQLLQERASFVNPKSLDQYYMKRNKKGRMLFNNDDFYERMANNSESINLSEIEDLQSNDIFDDLKVLINLLKKKSHEICIINKTHPELCIPTIRIFIPTLKYYVSSSDIPISLDSTLAHVYLDTYDINNAIIYLKKTGHEFLLKKAYFLEKFQKNGISDQECIAKLEKTIKGNMINVKEKYCLSKDIKVNEDSKDEKISLFNTKSKLYAKIAPASFKFLKELEVKNIKEIIKENNSLEEFDEYQFLDFLDGLLFSGFIEFAKEKRKE